MVKKVNKAILAGFIDEANSYLPIILKGIRDLQADSSRTETLEEIYRLVHTIKGASGMVGLIGLSHVAYFIEQTLESIGAHHVDLTDDTATLLAYTLNRIGDYLQEAEKGVFIDRPLLTEVALKFRRFRGLPEAEDAEALAELLAELNDEEDEEPAAAESVEPRPSAVHEEPEPTGAAEEEEETDQFDDLDEEMLAELLEAFWMEADEHIEQVNLRLADINRDGFNKEIIQDIRRRVHTLKGAAASVGIKSISRLTHRMEDLLDLLYDGGLELTPRMTELLCSSGDALEDMASRGTIPEQLVNDLYERYGAFLTDEGLGSAPGELDQSEERKNLPPELMEAFLVEAEDHLRTISLRLSELNRESFDRNLVQDIRRNVHTLKGAAGSFGLNTIAGLAHRMEDLLDRLYTEEIEPAADTLDLLCSSADVLEDLLTDAPIEATVMQGLRKHYARLLGGPEEDKKPERAVEPLGEEQVIDLTKSYTEGKAEEALPIRDEESRVRQPGEFVRVPIERLDELVRLVSELVITRTTFEQRVGNLVGQVNELATSIDRLRRIAVNLETQYEVTTLGGAKISAINPLGDKGEFDDLEFDRYTEFHMLTRELSETSSDIKTVGNDLGTLIGDFDATLNRQSRISSELQEKLMRVRMVPLATLATRLHRVVRVVARQQNKQVNLVLEGEQVELDKMMMEEIVDPLMHIIRNSVDHGIEPPELRSVLGKPDVGSILLSAYHEGNQVVIRIDDDGAGLEPNILKAKAVEGGYFSEAEVAELSAEEVSSLIFIPGFSTAGEVSEVSGRGVGMDIVRENVHKLKGTISIESTPGDGTSFTIRLPMTLAVTRALMVRSHREIFAVPLSAVTQILRVEEGDIEYVGQKAIIRVGQLTYPMLKLGEVLNLRQQPELSRRMPVLILQAGGKTVALVVDQIIQGREVVIKPLGEHLRYVRGVTGATIMGDGSVVLILNPNDLLEPISEGEQVSRGFMAEIASRGQRALNVMIVDDSVSVRRVLTNLIKSRGWNPIAAKDGLEALTIVQQGAAVPDVALVDIEMPRMDGYELTASLRRMDAYRDLPIIMVTSRGGEKHRNKGFEVGATEYLTKPYQDEMLTDLIQRLTSEKTQHNEEK